MSLTLQTLDLHTNHIAPEHQKARRAAWLEWLRTGELPDYPGRDVPHEWCDDCETEMRDDFQGWAHEFRRRAEEEI